MTSLTVAVALLLGQSVAPSPLPAGTCAAPLDTAIASLCAGEEALSQGDRAGAADDERDGARVRAVAAFRRAADLTRDAAIKKRALTQLERLYDADHLNLPHQADPVIRELIGISPGDVSPMFRLARLQERQGQFDAAESTLLAAHQQKPDDAAPYRELAQYFGRRAAAVSADKAREDRVNHPEDAARSDESGKPDQDGVFSLGGSVQAPQQLSSGSVPLPSEVTAAGITGLVTLEVVVDERGRVSDVRVVNSVPGLDATAVATARLWRFAPAMLNGRPVPVRFLSVVKF